MPAIDYINRPEYLLRPLQLYRRFLHPPHQTIDGVKTVLLPWGVPLKIYPRTEEVVERSLWIFGIYDLSLSEVLWRLTDPQETAIDIGANIGYTASLLACRVGKKGKVICFEPHPEIYSELAENVKSWSEIKEWSHLQLHQIALSDRAGVGSLKIPPSNRAAAALETSEMEIKQSPKENIYSVSLQQFDNIIQENCEIGVLKIDVEGHEYQVFKGAENSLNKGSIRDIIFEEHYPYPSKATQYLERHGYHLFRIWKGFWKPILLPPHENRVHRWEPPNYLATLNPQRARERLEKRGWQIFSSN